MIIRTRRKKTSATKKRNHVDIGALRLPTLARHQPITSLIPSKGIQLQRTDVQGGCRGGVFSVGGHSIAPKPQAPMPQAPVRNRQTRKVANA